MRTNDTTTLNNTATVNDTLTRRVEELLRLQDRPRLLSTTGTRAAVDELTDRNQRLEQVVGELAVELERLSARFERTIEQLDETPTGYSVSYPSAPR